MPTERQAPDALSVQTNLTGTVADVDEDPDAPDSSWLDWDGAGNTIALVTFPTPTGNPTTGANVQGFRVQIRKSGSTANNPTYALQLYESGSQVGADLATGTLTDSDLDPGIVVEGTWDAADLATADGSAVECRLQQTSGATGNPSNQRGIEVGAFEWNVDYTGEAASHSIAGAVAVSIAVDATEVFALRASLAGAVTVPIAIAATLEFTADVGPITVPIFSRGPVFA